MRKMGMFLLGLVAVVMTGGLVQAGMYEMKEDDDDNKFSIHGEVRFRAEFWSNQTDFTDSDATDPGEHDDDFDLFPYRVRMAAKGDLGHDIWVKGEFQGSGVAGGRIFGETPQLFGDEFETVDGNVALYQGWVSLKDIGESVADLTFGRFEIVFDRGLHYSNLPYYNGISHDGVMAQWDWEKFAIHGFWTRNVEGNLSTINSVSFFNGPLDGNANIDSGADVDVDYLGVHFTHTLAKDENKYHDVGYYLFYNTMNDAGLSAGEDDDRGKIYTLGARWGMKRHMQDGFHWNVEAAVQSGDFQPCAFWNNNIVSTIALFSSCVSAPFDPPMTDETLDQSSMVAEASFGYLWNNGSNDHKVWVGYTMASGDDDPDDDDQEFYLPLFTDFHNRLGYADQYALMNIEAISAGYKVNINDRHVFGGTYWMFSKVEEEASVISPLTGITIDCPDPMFLPSGEECEDGLSSEIDLFYDYRMTENFSFDTALAYVMPDDATEDHFNFFGIIDDEGEDDAWRLSLQARARF